MNVPIGLIVKILNPIITPISSFFLSRPKIYIEFLDKGYSSSMVQGTNNYKFYWRHELKLINNSNYDAYNIEISQLVSNLFDRMDKLGQHNNLEKRKDLILRTGIERILDNQTGLDIRQGTLSGLLPPGQDEFVILIKYENEKGRSFYTLFEFKNGIGDNKLYYRNPVKK